MKNDKENVIVEKTISFSLPIIKYCEVLEKVENMLLQNSYCDLQPQLARMYLKHKMQKVKLILFIK
jgi:hypothetical protein